MITQYREGSMYAGNAILPCTAHLLKCWQARPQPELRPHTACGGRQSAVADYAADEGRYCSPV